MFFAGIDIGTTNTKGVLIDSSGKVLKAVTLSRTGINNTNAEQCWLGDFHRAFKELTANSGKTPTPLAASITGQGGSFVLLDRNFKPCGPARLWTESAGKDHFDALWKAFDPTEYYQMTGWQAHPMVMSCKLRQALVDSEQDNDIKLVATTPDFVHAGLGLPFVSDVTQAQITGLYDIRKQQYDDRIIKWCHTRREMLPEVLTNIRTIGKTVVGNIGEVTFVTSSHDQYALMEAVSLQPDRSILLGTGTAWVLNARTTELLYDDACLLHPGCDISSSGFGNILTMGAIGCGLDLLLQREGLSYGELADMEPAFTEDGAPDAIVDADSATGTVRNTNNAELTVRRYMEWAVALVAFYLEKFIQYGHVQSIYMTGGATHSEFWPFVLAQTTGASVHIIELEQITAYGAALMARRCVLNESHPGTSGLTTRICEPQAASPYRTWYEKQQKPFLQETRASSY